MFHFKKILMFAGVASLMTGCMTMPSYQSMDEETPKKNEATFTTAVNYKIDPSLGYGGIQCLAIMPLSIGQDAMEPIVFSSSLEKKNSKEIEIYDQSLDANEKRQLLRKNLYAFIAPYAAKDIELSRVDAVTHLGDRNPDYKKLAKKLDCGWFLDGEITNFSSNYYGVYSNIIISAKLKIIRASDGKVVWQGTHEANSHDGGIPLSPIGLAMGVINAASNVNPEQVERVAGDLARRLARTMPLDADNQFLFAAKRKQIIRVIASYLNLRKGPGQNFEVSRVLKNNEPLQLLQTTTQEKSWLLVSTDDGVQGYVASRYVN